MKVGMKAAAYACLTICFLILACGTVASVKPMGAGNKALVFSVAGPVAPVYDIKMPMPYSVLRYRFGLNDNTDAYIGIHPTLGLFGNIGLDAGVTRHFARSLGWRPGISAGMSLYGFYDFVELGNARLYPELSLILSYDVSERVPVVYFGIESMFQLTKPYIVPVCLVGSEFTLGSRVALSVEARWYAPTESGDDRVVDYTIIPFGQGALGFALGFTYSFSRRQQ